MNTVIWPLKDSIIFVFKIKSISRKCAHIKQHQPVFMTLVPSFSSVASDGQVVPMHQIQQPQYWPIPNYSLMSFWLSMG